MELHTLIQKFCQERSELDKIIVSLNQLQRSRGEATENGRDKKTSPRRAEPLQKSDDSLRQLAARMETVREQERLRIARELHDELGQILTALKMDVGMLAVRVAHGTTEAEIGKRFAALSSMIDSSIGCVRQIASELRPGVLDNLGLSAAIEWQAQELQARTQIRCKLTGLRDNIPLSLEQSTAIFRIYQEILTNVARHAKATAIHITLKLSKADLILTVRDNGIGIESLHIADPLSLGLLGMKERALLLGGSLTIERRRRGGTTVGVRVPLANSPTLGR